MTKFNHYHNDSSRRDLPVIAVNKKIKDPSLYLPSKDLMAAVNVALNLQLPLLLTGEPGTGKTDLARHIADFFDLDAPFVFSMRKQPRRQKICFTATTRSRIFNGQTRKKTARTTRFRPTKLNATLKKTLSAMKP